MGGVLFFGCIFVTFGPALALFLLTIAQNNQLIILTIGGSFFWLISILFSSLWWFITYKIIPSLRTTYPTMIIFSVIIQELFRYFFYRLYVWGFPPTLQNRSTVSPSSSILPDPNVDPTSQATETLDARVQNNARLRSLSQMPNFLSVATALGLGSGVTYALVMFVSILWEASGPGALFSEACPTTSLFMVGSIMSSLFILEHILLSIIAFEGFRKRSRFLISSVWIVHLISSLLTLANLPGGSCAGSLIPVILVVLFCGYLARKTALESGFIRFK